MKSPLLISFPPLLCPPIRGSNQIQQGRAPDAAGPPGAPQHPLHRQENHAPQPAPHARGRHRGQGGQPSPPAWTPAPAAPPWVVSGAFCCSRSALIALWEHGAGMGWVADAASWSSIIPRTRRDAGTHLTPHPRALQGGTLAPKGLAGSSGPPAKGKTPQCSPAPRPHQEPCCCLRPCTNVLTSFQIHRAPQGLSCPSPAL